MKITAALILAMLVNSLASSFAYSADEGNNAPKTSLCETLAIDGNIETQFISAEEKAEIEAANESLSENNQSERSDSLRRVRIGFRPILIALGVFAISACAKDEHHKETNNRGHHSVLYETYYNSAPGRRARGYDQDRSDSVPSRPRSRTFIGPR